ncbi:MAG: dethiobiotin synthase [Thiotrichales bacterium]|nr:dethiobiotin synthase [Thiotrichales bacterium]
MSGCRACFITGTDTGVGKTRATLALMQAMKSGGHAVTGMKPVASGAQPSAGVLHNEDALAIMSACSLPTAYPLINPCVYAEAVAPQFAAAGREPASLAHILGCLDQLRAQSDYVFIEGVGGWRVPWSGELDAAVFVRESGAAVILVVGIRLGCINHALLSAEAIRSDQFRLSGWIASQLDPDYRYLDETLGFLSRQLNAPLIGHLPYQMRPSARDLAAAIRTGVLCRCL